MDFYITTTNYTLQLFCLSSYVIMSSRHNYFFEIRYYTYFLTKKIWNLSLNFMFFDTLCPSVHFLTKVLDILSLNLFEMNSLNFIWILHRTLYKNIFRNMFLIYFLSFLLFSFQFCFDLSSKIKLYFYLTINKNHQNLNMKVFVEKVSSGLFLPKKKFL